MIDAVIVDAVRTPAGRRGGLLKDHHPGDLAAVVLPAGVHRSAFDDDAGKRDGAHGHALVLQAMCKGGDTANATILELCS